MRTLALVGLLFAFCFGQAVAQQVPPPILYASTGVVTAPTAPAWTFLPCGPVNTNCTGNGNARIVTGVSQEPHDLWLLTITMYLSTATVSTNDPIAICARTGAVITVLDVTTAGATTCTSTPSSGNPIFMGGPAFGSNGTQNNNFSQKLIGHLTLTDNTQFTINCLIANLGSGPVPVTGYCSVMAQMY